MSIAKYPAYKETGLEWLEVIPSHWKVRRLKQFCDVFPSNVDKKSVQGEPPVKLCNYTDVYYYDVVGDCLEFMDATATEEQIEKFSLKAGDTIITKDSETPDDIAIAAYVPKDLPGVICGYHLSMVRPKPMVEGAFVKRLFDSIYTKSLMAVRANGLTRVGLSQYAIDNVELPLPPKEEQASITAFLDRETAKIDALIAEQQRLIELLQEKRQAVISHAVTKGLNPNAPMKDSGVEWLGQVPEHWTAQKASWLFRAEKGKKAQELTQEYCGANEGPFPVFSGQTKDGGVMGAIDSYEFDVGETGAILCTTVGAKAMSIRLITGQFSLSQNCMVITSKTAQVTPAFFEYGLQPLFKHERALIPDHMQPSFRMEDFNQFWVQVPPIDEQARIAKYLQEENQASSELATAISGGIGLLQERRSALISAAVTGQIDVRGFVEVEGSEL